VVLGRDLARAGSIARDSRFELSDASGLRARKRWVVEHTSCERTFSAHARLVCGRKFAEQSAKVAVRPTVLGLSCKAPSQRPRSDKQGHPRSPSTRRSKSRQLLRGLVRSKPELEGPVVREGNGGGRGARTEQVRGACGSARGAFARSVVARERVWSKSRLAETQRSDCPLGSSGRFGRGPVWSSHWVCRLGRTARANVGAGIAACVRVEPVERRQA
jgi:hypothetical protein